MHLALFPLDEQTCTLDVASCKIDLAFCILQLSFSLYSRWLDKEWPSLCLDGGESCSAGWKFVITWGLQIGGFWESVLWCYYCYRSVGILDFTNQINLSWPAVFSVFCQLFKDLLFAGEYSCLRVDLLFARQLSFFIVTVYVPCSMTVSVSWMSFWLDHKAVWLVNFKIITCCVFQHVDDKLKVGNE